MSPATACRHEHDRASLTLLLTFAAARVAVVLASLLRSEFGIFRDEFYYLACADRLAFGYVDHPPFSIWVLAAWRAIAGDSLFSLRLLSGLIGAGIVFVAGLITRQLGGSKRAQALACLITLLAPVQLGVGGFFSMNVIEYLVVVVLAWLLVRILQGDDRRLWIGFGIVLGIGVMNKHTLGVLALSMLAGLVFVPARAEFRRKEFWIGLACAALIVLPNAVWQVTHQFLSLEFYSRAAALKNLPSPAGKVLMDQVLGSNPIAALVWGAGLVWLLRGRDRPAYRALGIAYLLMVAVMVAARSNRVDRIASYVPVLAAAGAVAWERFLTARGAAWVLSVAMVVIALTGGLLAPLVMPVLSPAATSASMKRLGIEMAFENGVRADLPQSLADRFGWRELADSVAAVYERLPNPERAKTVLVGENYGEAGALEYYGRAHHLPRVISGHNSYWIWGPGQPADVYIIVGNPRSRLEQIFEDVREGARTYQGWQMNYERHAPIWVCRKPKVPLSELWPEAKEFI
jgi:4-amino-4-deoxy-L-arabinose transferase-like glycosyltransferase